MSGRRTAKLSMTLHEMGQALGLHETQRVVQMYVTPDPHVLYVVIEGGDELPHFEPMPLHSWREHGQESPYVKPDEIPKPD